MYVRLLIGVDLQATRAPTSKGELVSYACTCIGMVSRSFNFIRVYPIMGS